MNTRFPGFSLIEMALVLMIMGLIGGVTLSSLKVFLDWQKAAVTAERQEKILYALANYALQNKTVPYAADPDNPQGTQDRDGKRRRGILPYHDLGLPESFAKDGYHHWFTYVMDDRYGYKPDSRRPHCSPIHPDVLFDQALPQLCITFHSPGLMIKLPQGGPDTGAAVVIISHGPQGRGAYPHSLNPPPQGKDEELNTQSETLLVDRPISKDTLTPFSHKVVWVTGKYLMAYYARLPCPSDRIRDKPGYLAHHNDLTYVPSLLKNLPPADENFSKDSFSPSLKEQPIALPPEPREATPPSLSSEAPPKPFLNPQPPPKSTSSAGGPRHILY